MRKTKYYFGKRQQPFPRLLTLGKLSLPTGHIWAVPRMLREWYDYRQACLMESTILKINLNSVSGAMAHQGEMMSYEHMQLTLERRRIAQKGYVGKLTTRQMKELLHVNAA